MDFGHSEYHTLLIYASATCICNFKSLLYKFNALQHRYADFFWCISYSFSQHDVQISSSQDGQPIIREMYPLQLLLLCPCPLSVTLTAPVATNLQINSLVSAVNGLSASAVMLNKLGYGLPLSLVVDACGKIVSAKETFGAIAWNDSCPPHPIWFCIIHVCPTLLYCMIHQLPRQINLKSLPAVLPQIHLAPFRSNFILCTVNHSNINLMHHSV